MLHIGEEIPPELYQVVAQILIYVGEIDKKVLLGS
jgi:type III secretion system FlhB-like substrate exporter